MDKYQDRVISQIDLGKFLKTLDSDEGIRIENKNYFVFINKISKRFCINIENNNKEEFFYKYNENEVMDLLSKHLDESSKIFFY